MKNTILFLSLVCTIIFTGCGPSEEVLRVGKASIYYSKDIRASEVISLGDHLKATGFFKEGVASTIRLVGKDTIIQFKMPVRDGIEQDNSATDALRMFASSLSHEVFHGKRVEIHACNDKFETRRVYVMSE